MGKRYLKWLKYAVFIVLVYIPIFHHLDWQPINDWDESLFAMRAVYMAEEGEYLHNFKLWDASAPEQMSTKPPFTTWIQVLSLKIFGYNEFGLRLPIAFAAFLTILLILYISKKEFGDINFGLCAGFVLATSVGYIALHGSRTGDQDAALSLYMLAGLYAFYKYAILEEAKSRRKWLVVLGLSIVASMLTKYVYGLFFVPGMLLFLLYKKRFLTVAKRPGIWLTALSALVVVGAWLAHIEMKVPGFIDRAFLHEVFDRYTTTYAHHGKPFHYYFDNLINKNFLPWVYFFVISCIILAYSKEKIWKDFFVLLLFVIGSFLLVISFSETKAEHYTTALYPLLAIAAGIGLYEIIKEIKLLLSKSKMLAIGIFIAVYYFAVPIFYEPYMAILSRTYKPKLTSKDTNYGYLFRKIEKQNPGMMQFLLLQPGFDSQSIYYTGLYNRTKGYQIRVSTDVSPVMDGDTVMVCKKRLLDSLNQKFELQVVQSHENCVFAIVHQK